MDEFDDAGDRDEPEPNDPEDRSEEEPERSGPPSEDRVRLELILFAEFIQTLAGEDKLLDAVPFLLGRLGELRRVLFDYEVRGTERLLPIEDPDEREARRLLRKLEESKREMLEELGKPWTPPESEQDEEDEVQEE